MSASCKVPWGHRHITKLQQTSHEVLWNWEDFSSIRRHWFGDTLQFLHFFFFFLPCNLEHSEQQKAGAARSRSDLMRVRTASIVASCIISQQKRAAIQHRRQRYHTARLTRARQDDSVRYR